MKYNYVKVVSDGVFFAFLSFMIGFITFNYFSEKPYSLIAGICSGIIGGIFSVKISRKKTENRLMKKQDEKLFNATSIYLSTLNKTQANDLVFNLLSAMEKDCKYIDNRIEVLPENAVYIPIFSIEGPKKEDIIKYYTVFYEQKTAVILCHDIKEEVLAFSQKFDGIKFIYGVKLYNLLKEHSLISEETKKYIVENKREFSFKNFIYKKQARKFFGFGLVFSFLSFLVPIKIYYILIGVFFLCLSAFCRLFGKSE